jgi:hypothetical protein
MKPPLMNIIPYYDYYYTGNTEEVNELLYEVMLEGETPVPD